MSETDDLMKQLAMIRAMNSELTKEAEAKEAELEAQDIEVLPDEVKQLKVVRRFDAKLVLRYVAHSRLLGCTHRDYYRVVEESLGRVVIKAEDLSDAFKACLYIISTSNIRNGLIILNAKYNELHADELRKHHITICPWYDGLIILNDEKTHLRQVRLRAIEEQTDKQNAYDFPSQEIDAAELEKIAEKVKSKNLIDKLDELERKPKQKL